MRYHRVIDNEWVQPVRKNYYMKCCECGMVHSVDFRLTGNKHKSIQLRARKVRNNRKIGYYILADDEDGKYVATVKLSTLKQVEKYIKKLSDSPSFKNVEIVKLIRYGA